MNQQLCDPNRLSSFVRGELSDEAERELASHLDECESCGQALEEHVAEASAWREASVFLGDRNFQKQEGDFSVSESLESQIQHVLSQLSPTDDPHSLGRIGGYEVTGVIGSGGMGVVLKAREHSLDRVVAVKVMAPHLATSGSARQRFAREAKAAAAVLHPNVIAIHGVSNEQALPYLVMPYVRGESLQKRIDAEGPLPLVDTLRIGAQVASGLAAAHEQGLVHRDIKPGNILMEQGVERVTITDFGLARAVDDASMTRSGVIAGTPQYMSPQQACGEPIDARSDLFSLGSLLYAMCTGHSPFRAETSFGVIHRITHDEPRAITEINPDIPLWLEGVVMKLLSKRAEDRFQSAGDVAELLENCLSHTQHPATTPLPEPVVELASKLSNRRWRFKFIAAGAFLWMLLFAGVLIVLEWNKGTLRVESEADDVPIRIVQGKDIVEELTVSKSGESVRIAAGNYEVEIGGAMDGLVLDQGTVTLQRGGNDIVRIVKVAPVTNALGDWPYGRLMKDLQAIKPLSGVPVIPSGQPISGAMVDELSRRLEAVPEGELDKWVAELERITGDKLDDEMARQACRTYIVNRMSVLYDKLFFRARLISTSEAEAWKQAFETLLGEAIGQTDKAILDGGPSYAVPLILISTDALFEIDKDSVVFSGYSDIQEKYSTEAAVKYRKRLAQLSKHDIATWRSKVDRFGGTKLDAAMNIILLDDYFVDETFQDGDFQATLGGMASVSSVGQSSSIVAKESTASQTRLEFEAHPQDVIALQIGPSKHNKPLEWTSVSTQMGPFSVTITDEKAQLEDGSRGPGFTFTTQDAGGRTSTSYIAMPEDGPLPIGKFYLHRYKPTTLLDLQASVKVGEIKYADGTSAPVSVTARAANDTMVTLPVRVVSTGNLAEEPATQSSNWARRETADHQGSEKVSATLDDSRPERVVNLGEKAAESSIVRGTVQGFPNEQRDIKYSITLAAASDDDELEKGDKQRELGPRKPGVVVSAGESFQFAGIPAGDWIVHAVAMIQARRQIIGKPVQIELNVKAETETIIGIAFNGEDQTAGWVESTSVVLSPPTDGTKKVFDTNATLKDAESEGKWNLFKDPDQAAVQFETRLGRSIGIMTALTPASLDEAVTQFNRVTQDNDIGKNQSELTADEVIAAFRKWIGRKERNAKTRETIQQIIDTKLLQPGCQLSFNTRYVSEGHVFDIWEINFGDGSSYPWFKVRDTVLLSRVKSVDEKELWEQSKNEMADSFLHFMLGPGTNDYRSKEEQQKLWNLLKEVYRSSVNSPLEEDSSQPRADDVNFRKFSGRLLGLFETGILSRENGV